MSGCRIEIDPNLRVRGNQTIAGFEDIYDGQPIVGERCAVFEREAALLGHGWITAIDDAESLIYIDVVWSSLRIIANRGNPLVRPVSV